MPKQPALPEPAHHELDSMLTRKFGKEIANYFSGSPLNRVGFLRGDHTFLSQALRHPSTSFLLCNELQPLINEKGQERQFPTLAYVKYKDVEAVIGEDPYEKTEQEVVSQYRSDRTVPQMIFLGIDEKAQDKLSYQGKNLYEGAPYFALDVTPRGSVKQACEELISSLESRGATFAKGRAMDLVASDAAMYAEARQLLDWNARNPFCGQCGQPTLSVNGGFKRTCPPKDLSKISATAISTTDQPPKDESERPPCATRKGVSNLSFPRTDPTVIMAVVNSTSDRILLGRQKRWPPYWYSTLAGFCEPAESVEEAVRREVYEEAGCLLGRVVIHSTQPWPYPANLMIGAIGQATPEGETIDLGNDPELDDAKWFDFDEVKHALRISRLVHDPDRKLTGEQVRHALRVGTSGLGEDAGPEYVEGGLRLPPSTAIAHQLMAAVVGGLLAGDSKI